MIVDELESGVRWLFGEIYNEKEFIRRQRHYMQIVTKQIAWAGKQRMKCWIEFIISVDDPIRSFDLMNDVIGRYNVTQHKFYYEIDTFTQKGPGEGNGSLGW